MLPSVSARTANRSSSFQSGNSSRREFKAGPYCDFNFFDSSSSAEDCCDDDADAGTLRLGLEECEEEPCDFGFDGLCESVVEDIVRVIVCVCVCVCAVWSCRWLCWSCQEEELNGKKKNEIIIIIIIIIMVLLLLLLVNGKSECKRRWKM